MIIKNESASKIHLGFTSQSGTTLEPGETTEVSDELSLNSSFVAAKDAGVISVVSYDDSDDSYVAQKELKDLVATTVDTSAPTIPVGPTRDIATLADGIALLDDSYFRNGVTFQVDSGIYPDSVSLSAKVPDKISIIGDNTRSLAGYHWKNGLNNYYWPPSYAGSGTISITNSGNEIIVTCGTTNPDFVSGGIVAGDKVITLNTAGATAEYELANAIDNRLILTTTAPSMTGDTGFFIAPNVQLGNLSISGPREINLEGVYFKDKRLSISYSDYVVYQNICTFSSTFNFYSFSYIKNLYGGRYTSAGKQSTTIGFCNNVYIWDSLFLDDGTTTFSDLKAEYIDRFLPEWIDIVAKAGPLGKVGVWAEYIGYILANYGCRVKNLAYPLFYQGVKNGYSWGDIVDTGQYGIWCAGATMYLDGPTVQNQSVEGIRADNKSLITVASPTLSGNASDYSPAVSGTEGNNDSIIVHP